MKNQIVQSVLAFHALLHSEKMLMTGNDIGEDLKDLFIKKGFFLNLKSAQFNLELNFKLFKNITGE